MFEGELVRHTLRTSEMGHNYKGTAFLEDFLESRNGSPDTGVIGDFKLLVERDIEVYSDDGFLAGEIISVNVLLHNPIY